MDIARRNNVRVSGSGSKAIIFAHGYGCDQSMWRFVAPAFEDRFRVILFDHVGCGMSDSESYSRDKYASLAGYVDDVVELGGALGLNDAIFVGHSVSAMIGVLASLKAPDLFGQLVLVSPSPRYIDDAGYVGGFSGPEIDELLSFLGSNHMGWAATMAPVIMANPDRPDLAEELNSSFCRMDPVVAHNFARVTFTSDNRDDLGDVSVPTLILQCRSDSIAPTEVGDYVHSRIPGSRIVYLDATGHCPNLSAPGEVVAAINAFV